VGLTIDPEVADPEDTETLADLVLAAVRDANSAARQLAAEQMGEVTGGFGQGLGGEDAGPELPGSLGFQA
jgi:DNA-binding protein YbaB